MTSYPVEFFATTTLAAVAARAVTSATSLTSAAKAGSSLTSTSSSAAPSASSTGTQSGGGGGAGDSPYLYFIALGLGIVFTNLWIIIGVRYCYQRRRETESEDEGDGGIRNGIPLSTARPGLYFAMGYVDDNTGERRRRRQKRLMKLEELNRTFPVTKYKMWTASHTSNQGAGQGGISAEAALSAKDLQSAEMQQMDDSRLESTQQTDTITLQSNSAVASGASLSELPPSHASIYDTPHPSLDLTELTAENATSNEDPSKNELTTAETLLPPDSAEGDMCAVCLDTLESENDVRVLTCDHVFHDECIVPWFTSRRACCPLCKKDYYTGGVASEPSDQSQVHIVTDIANAVQEQPTMPTNRFRRGLHHFITAFTARPTRYDEEGNNFNRHMVNFSHYH